MQNSMARLLALRKSFLTVLTLCAMPEETKHMREQMSQYGFLRAPNDRFFRNNVIVDVKTSGIGMVNAAANASLLMHTLQPDVVFSVGCAGAHIPHLKRGDVVVGTEQICTSSVIVRDDGHDDDRVVPYGDRGSSILAHQSDETLVGMARKSRAPLLPFSERDPLPTIVTGRVASSDTWTDTKRGVERLHKMFGTACEDMEAAAVAVVAREYNAPFVSVKDISNSVFIRSEESFDAVQHIVPPMAGKNAATVASDLLRRISDM